jgi:hypothetical protein
MGTPSNAAGRGFPSPLLWPIAKSSNHGGQAATGVSLRTGRVALGHQIAPPPSARTSTPEF